MNALLLPLSFSCCPCCFYFLPRVSSCPSLVSLCWMNAKWHMEKKKPSNTGWSSFLWSEGGAAAVSRRHQIMNVWVGLSARSWREASILIAGVASSLATYISQLMQISYWTSILAAGENIFTYGDAFIMIILNVYCAAAIASVLCQERAGSRLRSE